MIRNLGKLRHFVDVQRNTPSADAATNQPIASWAVIDLGGSVTTASIPCHVETVSGGEVRRGQQMTATTTHLVTMHHPQGAFAITPRDRLYWTSESLALNVISAIDPDGMRSELLIQCKAAA